MFIISQDQSFINGTAFTHSDINVDLLSYYRKVLNPHTVCDTVWTICEVVRSNSAQLGLSFGFRLKFVVDASLITVSLVFYVLSWGILRTGAGRSKYIFTLKKMKSWVISIIFLALRVEKNVLFVNSWKSIECILQELCIY